MLGAYVLPQAKQKGEIGIHSIYNFNRNHDLISGSEVLGDSHISRNIHSWLTQVDYSPIDKFSISFSVPVLWQKETTEGPTGSHSLSNKGIGDISIWLAYHHQKDRFSLSGAIGLKAPTGNTNDRDGSTGIPYPLSLQIGSGSWDFGFNLFSSIYLGSSRKFSIENQVSGRLNGPGKSFKAHENYRFGHQFQILTSLSYHTLLGTIVSDLFAGVMWLHQGQDQFDGGFDNENTGGNWVNAAVGGNFFLSPRVFINVNGVIPIYRNLNGLQLSTTWQGAFGINYLISKK